MWREINSDLHVVKKGIELPRSRLLVSPASRNGEPVYVVWDPGDPDDIVAEFSDDPADDLGGEDIIREARDRIEPIKWRRIMGTNGRRWWITCPSHTMRKKRGIRAAPCITDWGALGYCYYMQREVLCYRLLYRHDHGWKRDFWRLVSLSTLMDAMRELEEDKEANNVAQERQYCNC